jgi:hypothetical protein
LRYQGIKNCDTLVEKFLDLPTVMKAGTLPSLTLGILVAIFLVDVSFKVFDVLFAPFNHLPPPIFLASVYEMSAWRRESVSGSAYSPLAIKEYQAFLLVT